MKRGKIILFVFIGAVLIIQFIPVQRSNSPPTSDITAPKEVKEFLQRSCYDCHSYETKWPWYSYIAPLSWDISRDVSAGREQMNFSIWDSYSSRDKRHLQEEILEKVKQGKMPLKKYLFLHPSAKVRQADIETLEQWIGPIDDQGGKDDSGKYGKGGKKYSGKEGKELG